MRVRIVKTVFPLGSCRRRRRNATPGRVERAMVAREPRVQPPILEAYSERPLFNTKAVGHQTGVPPPTLRAWERRYGILSPRRGENDYQLYSQRDMMMVAWLRERVESRISISHGMAPRAPLGA